jgi:hypothetical protein
VRVTESPTRSQAPSVIYIVENLNRGAVENWLVRMLRFGVERGVPLDWTFWGRLPVWRPEPHLHDRRLRWNGYAQTTSLFFSRHVKVPT